LENASSTPQPENIPPGTTVRISGLGGRPEFNGQTGIAVSWDSAKGRIGIKLDKSGEKLSLKLANLEVLEPPAIEKAKQKKKMDFAAMFSKPGALSAKEADVVWQGSVLPRVFFDIEVDGKPYGRVVIELWPHKTPKSAENFRALCTGERGLSKRTHKPLCYRGSRFSHVIDGIGLMGGIINTKTGNKRGGESIYGDDYEDLSCRADGAAEHDRPGIVAMGWSGDKPPVDPQDEDPNKRTSLAFGSRFTITIQPEPGFNGHLPVVGVVVEGMDVLQAVSKVEVDKKHRPEDAYGVPIDVVVADCGELPPDESGAEPEPSAIQKSSEGGDEARCGPAEARVIEQEGEEAPEAEEEGDSPSLEENEVEDSLSLESKTPAED